MQIRFFGLLLAGLCLAADLKPIKQIQPDYSDLHSAYIIDHAQVRLTVTGDGVPFSVQSDVGLPDKLVKAIAAWRYEPFGSPTQGAVGIMKVTVPRPLSPVLESELVVRWTGRPETAAAIKRGNSLNETRASALLASLTPNEEPDLNRTALIVYYAQHPSADSDRQRAALVLWLIEHYPQADILSSSYAVLNPNGPGADPANASKAQALWKAAVDEYPKEYSVTQHAVNFLLISDPTLAASLLSRFPQEPREITAVGTVYGWMALGVNGIDLETGNPVSTGGMAPQSADFILKSSATEFVLSATKAFAHGGRSLAAAGHLPSGYAELCERMLGHAKQLYPDTRATCDTSKPADTLTVTPVVVGGRVIEASLIKKVQPAYPEEAKRRGIQGTEDFQAVIGQDGEIHQLELRQGVLALYPASRDAVFQWRYRPTLYEGKPTDVTTEIVVNFSLGH